MAGITDEVTARLACLSEALAAVAEHLCRVTVQVWAAIDSVPRSIVARPR